MFFQVIDILCEVFASWTCLRQLFMIMVTGSIPLRTFYLCQDLQWIHKCFKVFFKQVKHWLMISKIFLVVCSLVFLHISLVSRLPPVVVLHLRCDLHLRVTFPLRALVNAALLTHLVWDLKYPFFQLCFYHTGLLNPTRCVHRSVIVMILALVK